MGGGAWKSELSLSTLDCKVSCGACHTLCPRPHPLSGLLQNYIARFGHGSAKLARQAQSKEKTLQKMMASGLTERVVSDKVRADWDVAD